MYLYYVILLLNIGPGKELGGNRPGLSAELDRDC